MLFNKIQKKTLLFSCRDKIIIYTYYVHNDFVIWYGKKETCGNSMVFMSLKAFKPNPACKYIFLIIKV